MFKSNPNGGNVAQPTHAIPEPMIQDRIKLAHKRDGADSDKYVSKGIVLEGAAASRLEKSVARRGDVGDGVFPVDPASAEATIVGPTKGSSNGFLGEATFGNGIVVGQKTMINLLPLRPRPPLKQS